MTDYHVVISLVASVVGIVSLVPYFRDIFRGTTKPHVFTWLVWSLSLVIVFFAQAVEGGGVGVWATGIEALACFVIAVLAFSRGEKSISPVDWMLFVTALFGIVLWQLADSPLLAVILIAVVDVVAFAPTFRKAYWKPDEETASAFVFSAVRWALVLVALESLNPTTALYPITVGISDALFVVMLLLRRRQLAVQGKTR